MIDRILPNPSYPHDIIIFGHHKRGGTRATSTPFVCLSRCSLFLALCPVGGVTLCGNAQTEEGNDYLMYVYHGVTARDKPCNSFCSDRLHEWDIVPKHWRMRRRRDWRSQAQ